MNKILKSLLKTRSITRTVSVRNFRNLEKKDPGIRKRSAVFQENLQNPSVEDELDDLEADFFEIGKSHKQYQRDVDAFREQIKYHIVRQKYFKEKLPNFLTWADKQQIRHLYNTNPEEWCVERLSEGFPALPDTIQKIVRNKWIPKNPDRVKKHDAAVQENWLLFKTKKYSLKLLPEVIAHLDKFTSRELNLNPDISEIQVQDITKRELVKKGGEFSNIIQSYEALKGKNSKNHEDEQKLLKDSWKMNNRTKELIISDDENVDNFQQHVNKLNKKDSMKTLTYNELQSKLIKGCTVAGLRKQKETETDDPDVTTAKEIILQPEELSFKVTKFKSESQVNLYKPTRDYKNLIYPERIRIPENKHKKGYTYKLKDCFYDSDGEFLYRVPGM